MKFAVVIGFPLSLMGLILYCPPVVKWLTVMCGGIGRFGGLVLFAVGWALILAYLAFNLGMEYQKRSENE